jgi:predicted nucleic acid-binding protein
MKKPFLIDTNVLIDLTNGVSRVQPRLEKCGRVFVSPVVRGEFMAGVRNNAKSRARKRVFDSFMDLPNVVRPPLTDATADNYGKLWQFLSDTGRRIPPNDIWIAAHAMELSATLVTTDRHFDDIPNLDVLYAGPDAD